MNKILQTLSRNPAILILWLSLAPLAFLSAQQVEYLQIRGQKKSLRLNPENKIHAIVVKAEASLFGELMIETEPGKFLPTIDEHHWPDDGLFHSNPLVFDEALSAFEVTGLPEGSQAGLYLIHVPDAVIEQKPVSLKTHCEKPEMIYPEVWRSGLPAPDYNRIWNPVNNIILHHSATSNSLTNHLQLVRSIYTYHTEVNRWSDIGYNYLIANDGTIYAGRDPGELIHEDEVLGAHFCASNTGTLGVCILGTYTDSAPTQEALEALNRLLSWKTAKDSLPPHGTHPHPLNPQLDVIAGHRDGCATLCPGDAFIDLFQQIRHNCNTTLEDCGIFLSINEYLPSNELLIRPNPLYGNTFSVSFPANTFNKAYLVDMKGTVFFPAIVQRNPGKITISTNCLPGIYVVVVETRTQTFTEKLIKLNR